MFIYSKGFDIAYLILYVDDIILNISFDSLHISIMFVLVKKIYNERFGPLTYFLGISVTHASTSLVLSQCNYAEEIIDRAGMSSCNLCVTPIDTKGKPSLSMGCKFHEPGLYSQLAGTLQYLTFTRPDISHVVRQICLHMHHPFVEHMSA